MRSLRPFAIALSAAALAACNPELRGECASQADCPSGTTCSEGLCLANGTPLPDGGVLGTCEPACGTDHHCDGLTCVPDFPATVVITSPAAGTVVGAQPVDVTATAKAAGGVTSVEFLLGTVAKAPGTKAADGTWRATIDAAPASVTDGTYALIAHMTYGSAQALDSAPVELQVDKTGPKIDLAAIPYPSRPDGHPAKGMFLRSDTIVVTATITDAPAGLGATQPSLSVTGLGDVTGVPGANGTYTFTFDGRLPEFAKVTGDVPFRITAQDRVGNRTSATGAFGMTRVAWRWVKPRGQPLRTAVTIAGDKLFVGGDDHFVYAIKRADGSTAWAHDVGASVVGHVAAGETLAYATTTEGRVYGLRMDEPLAPGESRAAFRCPDLPTDGDLKSLVSGVAIGKTVVSSTDARSVETLFAYTANGQLRLFRREPFPINANLAVGCMNSDEYFSNANNEAGVPALVDESGTTMVYLGDKSGDVHKVSVGRLQNGVIRLTKVWSQSAKVPSAGGKVLVPPAIMASPLGGFAVVAGLDNGYARVLDTSGAPLWNVTPVSPLPNALDAPPVVTSSGVVISDERGRAQKLNLSDGKQSWRPEFNGLTRAASARASSVAAADGRVYFPAGAQLNALKADGTLEWAYDTRPTGSGLVQLYTDLGTPALACDGTLYVATSDTSSGYVVALVTDSRELAHEAWPKAFHDNRNSSNYGTALPGASCTD